MRVCSRGRRGLTVALRSRHPNRSPYHPDTIAVKRITALEGDLVRTRPPFPDSVVRVPQGHVWVEGDGPHDKSIDSNTYGPISIQLITGRITHFVYPWRKLGQVRWWEYEK